MALEVSYDTQRVSEKHRRKGKVHSYRTGKMAEIARSTPAALREHHRVNFTVNI